MNAAAVVLSAWVLFAATHLLLGLPPWRDRLAARYGEQQFVALFSAVAAVTLGLLALAVWTQAGTDPAAPGVTDPALGRAPVARALLLVVSWLGLTLATAGLLNYMRSPMALFRRQLHAPAGIERITRHAFFVGFALFAGAHALLASTLASALHFAGYALLAIGGSWLQDRKLAARHGAPYRDYLAQTSLLPFVAVLQGRQRLPRDERMTRRLALSAVIALLLFAAHPLWAYAKGALLPAMVAAGGVLASARRFRHARSAAASIARPAE